MLKNGSLDINPPERELIREAHRRYLKSGRVMHFIELNRVCSEIGGEGLAALVTQHAYRMREHTRKPFPKEPATLDAQLAIYSEVLLASHGRKINTGSGVFGKMRRMLGMG